MDSIISSPCSSIRLLELNELSTVPIDWEYVPGMQGMHAKAPASKKGQVWGRWWEGAQEHSDQEL
jgi:hypothetical protein